MSPEDVRRIEKKVDSLTDAVRQLILFDERQKQHAHRLDNLEKSSKDNAEQTAKVDRKLDQWVNRGMGAWVLLATVAATIKTFLR